MASDDDGSTAAEAGISEEAMVNVNECYVRSLKKIMSVKGRGSCAVPVRVPVQGYGTVR